MYELGMTRDECVRYTSKWFGSGKSESFEFSLFPLDLTDSFPACGSPNIVHNHCIKVLICQRVFLFSITRAGGQSRGGFAIRSLRRFWFFNCEVFNIDLVRTGIICQT